MRSGINIQEYTQDRDTENISVEINSEEQSHTLSFSSLKTNKKCSVFFVEKTVFLTSSN